MTIRSATPADLPEVRRLLRQSTRSFLTVGFEDLPALLTRASTVVGETGRVPRSLWGVVAFELDARQPTLPATAPSRVPLRVAGLAPGILVLRRLPDLVRSSIEALPCTSFPRLAVALTELPWLNAALRQVGFRRCDGICFYERTRHDTPDTPQPATLRSVREEELARLARLDSETFDPLWHMGEAELLQLCFSCRVEVALWRGELAGYAALSVQAPLTPWEEGGAQLVRLAIHPRFQGRGIGRQLLAASIAHAHAQGVYRIYLNTQESNVRSQRLYAAFHFRRRGRNLPVLARLLDDPPGGHGISGA